MVNTVEVRIAGTAAPGSLIPRPLQITHGRSHVGSQPDAPTVELEWLDPVFPHTLGDDVQVWAGLTYQPVTYDDPVQAYDSRDATYDSATEVMRQRFGGTIAAILGVAAAGMVRSWLISCVGHQARLGSRPVKITRPAETDVARVAAIAAAAGATVTVVGPAGVRLAAGDVDSDALSALWEVCESTGGMLWQGVDGVVRYGTAAHRADDSSPRGLLPVDGVDSDLSWAQAVDDIINQVTVSWGPPDTPSEATHNDLQSQAQPWGVRSVGLATLCASEADAEALALLILGRRAWPYWGTPEAVLVGDPDDTETRRLVANLDVSAPVLVPFTTTPGPTPSGPMAATVEGWVETFGEAEYTLQLALSDQARWVVTGIRTYTELAEDFPTYADVAAGGTYLNVLIEEAT